MAIANTNDTALRQFVESTPDWEKDYRFSMRWRTTVQRARSAAAQRARRRGTPRWSISYRPTPSGAGESYSWRKAQGLKQLGGYLVVPIWHLPHTPSSISATTATVTDISTRDRMPWRTDADGFVYIVEAGKTSVFMRLSGTAGTTVLTYDAAPVFPVAEPWPSFTTAARIYPCITGVRSDTIREVTLSNPNSAVERISVDQL